MAEEKTNVVNETTTNEIVENTPQEESTEIKTEPVVENTNQEEIKSEEKKVLDLNELLKQKEFASQFDAKVSKSINTAKEKWEKEFNEKLNKEKQELENSFENEKQTYETKITLLSKNVKPENVDDVIVLANKYKSEDSTIDEAVDKILEKYPHFKNESNKITKVGKEVDNTKKPSYDQTKEWLKKNGYQVD